MKPHQNKESSPVFRRGDKLAFVLAFGVALTGYVRTLSPAITLEMAGELAVAADYLGVPHNPGYPVWTLLAWFFQWIFHLVEFRGYPNPAWPIALMSAVFAAASVGLVAMLVSSGGRRIMAGLQTSNGSIRQQPFAFLAGFFWILLVFTLEAGLGLLAFCVGGGGIVLLGVNIGSPSRNWVGHLALGVLFGLGVGLPFAVGDQSLDAAWIALGLVGIAVFVDLFLSVLQWWAKQSGRPLVGFHVLIVFPFFVGVAVALLWAFSPTLWSQAVIVETHTLTLFLVLLLVVFAFAWMIRPDSSTWLFGMAFVFGLGFANIHQPMLFVGLFLLVAIWFRERRLFAPVLTFVCLMSVYFFFQEAAARYAGIRPTDSGGILERAWASIQLNLMVGFGFFTAVLFLALCPSGSGWSWRKYVTRSTVGLAFSMLFAVLFAVAAAVDFGFARGWRFALGAMGVFFLLLPLRFHQNTVWPRVYGLFGLVFLGLSFLFFLPVSSEQNPPMNWSYPRTFSGFEHTLVRGTSEEIHYWGNASHLFKPLFHRPKELAEARLARDKAALDLDEKSRALAIHERVEGSRATRTLLAEQAVAVEEYDLAVGRIERLNESRFRFVKMVLESLFGVSGEYRFSMLRQVIWWMSLFPLFAVAALLKFDRASRAWSFLLLAGLFSFSLPYIIWVLPTQSEYGLHYARVFFLPTQVFWVLLIGIGVVVVGAILCGLGERCGRWSYSFSLALACILGLVGTIFLPGWQLWERDLPLNMRDYGDVAMNGHDFGWRFGFHQLRGANGIILDKLVEREAKGMPPRFLLDEAALESIATVAGGESVDRLRPLATGEFMDQRTFQNKILSEIDPPLRDQVKERCAIAAFKRADKPISLNHIAREHMRRNEVDPDGLDIRLTRDSELLEYGLKRGVDGDTLEVIREAGRYGARFYEDRDALLNETTFEALPPSLLSEADLERLRSIASERVWSDDEARAVIRKQLRSPDEGTVNRILTEARLQALYSIPEFDPDYPPEMEPHSILYGGTDPGRFVLSYMVHSAKVRPDVKVLTQNMLAEGLYMRATRDWYGEEIWVPSTLDFNEAYKRYFRESATGQIRDNLTKQMRDHTTVYGVMGVMHINSNLIKMQHDKCKRDHAFYVEESYPMQWMYPYLKPHGLVLQLHPEPVELTKEDIGKDMRFWKRYCRELERHPEFQYDFSAQRTFSKLRLGIAGLYEAAGDAALAAFDNAKRDLYYNHAELAYREALRLCPESLEAPRKYARLLFKMRKFDEVVAIASVDRENPHLRRIKKQAESLKKQLETLEIHDAQIGEFITRGEPVPREEYESMVLYYRQFQELEKFDQAVRHLSKTAASADSDSPSSPSSRSVKPADKQMRVVEACRTAIPYRPELHRVAVDAMRFSFPDDPRGYLATAVYLLRNLEGDEFAEKEIVEECLGLVEQAAKLSLSASLFAWHGLRTEFQSLYYLKHVAPKEWARIVGSRQTRPMKSSTFAPGERMQLKTYLNQRPSQWQAP